MRFFKRVSLCCLVVWVSSMADSRASIKDPGPTIVRFCVPQNDFYPFFITRDSNLTGINLEITRQIFNSNSLQDVTVRFEKRPWKRCNADLEKGNVDMMIGGFDENRLNVVYPNELGFSLRESAVSTADVCFSSIKGKQMETVKKGLSERAPFVVGIEPGFTKKHDGNINPEWLVLFNPIEKYRMLELGRVDAIVQVCRMDGRFPIETKAETAGFLSFETIYPPYLSNPAYVLFSEDFAKQHENLAKRIVALSLSIDKAQVYDRYKPKN